MDHLSAELESQTGTYKIAPESCEEILERHSNFLKVYFLDAGNAASGQRKAKDKLGYLSYLMPKFHKLDERFIAALSRCSTTDCSQFLSKALGLVLTTLRALSGRGLLDDSLS